MTPVRAVTRAVTRAVVVAAGVWALALQGGVVWTAAQTSQPASPAPTAAASTVDVAQQKALGDRYCASCHNQRLKLPAGLPLYLDNVDYTNVGTDAETWERVLKKLSAGAMPPPGSPHPGAPQLEAFRTWLDGALDRAAEAAPNPGHVTLHRLNRTEYANAIRDLLALDVDVTALLPPDSSEFGFDNIASVLKVTPSLLERYVAAAVRISTLAVGDVAVEPEESVVPVRLDYTQNDHIAGLPLGTRGGTLVRYTFPADGEYLLSAGLFRPVDNADSGIEGQDSPHEFQILLDGQAVHTGLIGGPQDHEWSRRNLTAARDNVAERMRTKVKVTAGAHDVGFTFVERVARSQDIYEPSIRGSQDIHVGSERPKLTRVAISGPLSPTGVAQSESRRRLFACRPTAAVGASACARRVLSAFARRAYRRPVTSADVDPLMEFYERGRTSAGQAPLAAAFDAGIRAALPRVLASPSFLFRAESDPPNARPGSAHALSDIELVSRLSFFLWSSIPDDTLLNLASTGRLRAPGVLERQVKRMLADPRAEALTTNFLDQWLALRNLEKVAPDLLGFSVWDLNLRQGLQRETQMLFGAVVRENRSAMELLNADYSFMNERVARHYGIPGIFGSAFRRVPLTDPNRQGLLGHGSILALTSVATRTSPVFRGKWILTNLLNMPPLPPPDDVPSLDENTGAAKPRSVRERLESHRANPVCASCHRTMDPIGFALENFDAVGQWRSTTESGGPVDASGVLIDGTTIDGPVALRRALSARPDVFVGTLTEKLLIYALGRGLEAYDRPVVRRIVRAAGRNEYRTHDIVMGIVTSRPFQNRMVAVD